MSHGLHAFGIDGVHLLDQPEYPGQFLRVVGRLLRADLQPREMCYFFYLGRIE
jgi:hypothetical protein